MAKRLLHSTALAVSGLTATGIGGFILLAPQAFYAGYGIDLGTSIDLLSELRAPGANLGALGVLMLAGLFRPAIARFSLTVSVVVFLAFATGRTVGLLVDGVPSNGIVIALVIELAIGCLCLAMLVAGRNDLPRAEPASSLSG